MTHGEAAAHAIDKLVALYTNPETWTQGRYAKDDAGHEVKILDPTAVCWCVWGGLGKVGGSYGSAAKWYVNEVAHTRGYSSAINFNDVAERTLPQVLGLLADAKTLALSSPLGARSL